MAEGSLLLLSLHKAPAPAALSLSAQAPYCWEKYFTILPSYPLTESFQLPISFLNAFPFLPSEICISMQYLGKAHWLGYPVLYK